MIRRASTEALCNLSSHSAMVKLLRKRDNIKLWLGLVEEWVTSPQDPTALATAKAAAGTLAMISADSEIAGLLCAEDCARTFLSVLECCEDDMAQRVLVAILEICSSDEVEHVKHFSSPEMLSALQELLLSENLREIVVEIAKHVPLLSPVAS